MFEERPEGSSFFGFTGPSNTEQKLTAIEVGDEAELRLEGERVRVKVTAVLEDSSFEGIIQGFEPSHAQEYQGYREKQQIPFEKKNIFIRYAKKNPDT